MVEVEREVEVEKEVERLVTPTPLPDVVTPQGKVMPPDAAPLELQIRYTSVEENKHLDVPRNIYDANSVLHWGTEPMLRRNEMMELVPAIAESYEVNDAESTSISISARVQCGTMAPSPPTTGSSPSAISPIRSSTPPGLVLLLD